MRTQKEQNHQMGKASGPKTSISLACQDDEGEQVSRGLHHLVPRNAGGAQWTWEKVTVVADSGAAENVMPRSMFPRWGSEVQEWQRVQGTREGEHQELRPESCPSGPPEGFVRKSTWQVADVRRPLVSASHIIQAGNDLLIWEG